MLLLTYLIFTVNDRLPYHIRDGVRYVDVNKRGTKIRDGIKNAKKRFTATEDGDSVQAKKHKAVYLVNPKKFASVATTEEMAQRFTDEQLGKEDTHRILQCKIR
jgi:hypothetical protein